MRALRFDATGKLYVGGRFLTAGGVVANNVACWSGSAWSALGNGTAPGSNGEVFALALAPGGDLLAVGNMLISGLTGTGVLRWDGSSWHTLGPGAIGQHSQYVMALAVTPTGDLFLGGDFEQQNGVGATRLARWNGSTWQALAAGPGNGLNARASAVAVAPNGSVYVAGYFFRAGGNPFYQVACWNGSSWSSVGLGNGINGSIEAMAVAPSGDVYIGGNFSQVGTVAANNVARWNGTAWSALSSSTGNGVSGWVRAMAVTPTGEVYVGGQFSFAGGRNANAVVHWNGTAWDNMSGGIPNSNQSPTVWAMALALNGNLYVSGGFDRSSAGGGPNILSWNGSTWTSLP